MPPTPRIELLGVPRLILAQGKPHVLERHDAALLAWLALRGPTPRSRIVSLLWPDVPTPTAQINLRQRLFRLKQRTGSEIVVSAPVMALADGVHHDLESTAPELDAAATINAQTLLGSLDYEDCGELAEWVAAARERWAGEWRKKLAQHAAQLESEGRIAEALAFAERLTLEAPSAEHAHRRVMRLHYRRGDRAAALAAFERCCVVLAEQLGTRPGLETRDLAALIERSGALPPPVAAPSPVAALRPPRLIGREVEWRTMEAAWQARQTALLLGEPGMGKSRLAADFAAAQHQPTLHRAHPGDARMPYSLLARLLRDLFERFGGVPQDWIVTEFSRLLPELGAQPVGKLEPLRLRQAFVAATAHWQAQGLAALVVDDLHYADEASLELLLGWLDEARRPQIVMTVRSNELPQALRDWLRDHGKNRVCEVMLAPLTVQAIAALLESLAIPGLNSAAWAESLARHTGGNPRFIRETLKARLSSRPDGSTGAAPTAGGLAAPEHIGKLLDMRLAQLAPEALRLARVAALAGADFSAARAAQVLGGHVLDLSEAWGELERAHVISEGAFAHDLILEATLRSVPDAIAIALHRAMAQALEADAHAPARVAHHWHGAREWARAAPQFERAAKAAHAASRPVESLAAWDAAARCHEQAGAPAAAFQSRCDAVAAAIVVGPSDRVEARVDALVADSRTEAERLTALIAQAQHVATGGAHARAAVITAEALTIAKRLGNRRQEFMAASIHGVALTMIGEAADGLALFKTMAPTVDEAGDEGVECEFCAAFGNALYAGAQIRESVAWFERAVDMAQRLGETNMLAVNLGNLAGMLGRLGQSERALEVAVRAQAAQARLGELRGEPYAISLMNVGIFYLIGGRFGEALAAHQQALDLAREGKAATLTAFIEHHLSNAFVRLGQPARARQMLSALAADAPFTVKARRAIIEWRIAAFATRPGPERLQQALQELGSHGSVSDRLSLQLAIAAALPAEESVAWSRRIRQAALVSDQPTVALTALIRLAEAQRLTGSHEEAAASARTAVAEAAGSGPYDMPTPEFWWLAFQAFDSAGCNTEALNALRTGADWVSRAAAHVPDAFRDSFLHRSQHIPRLVAMANRRLGA